MKHDKGPQELSARQGWTRCKLAHPCIATAVDQISERPAGTSDLVATSHDDLLEACVSAVEAAH